MITLQATIHCDQINCDVVKGNALHYKRDAAINHQGKIQSLLGLPHFR